MFKKFLPFLLFILSCSVTAQQKEIDSLKQSLQTKLDDTVRVNQLNELAFLYHTSKPDTTLVLARKALNLAEELGFIRGQAKGLNAMAAAFYATGNYPQALKFMISSLKKWEKEKNRRRIAITYNNIAAIHSDTENYEQALDYLFKALKINREIGVDDLRIFINIGNIYLKQKKLDSARFYVIQSYDWAIRQQNNSVIRVSSTILGSIYFEMDQPGMAMEYYKTGFDKGIYDINTADSALGTAEIFKDQNQQDSTLYYAKIAYDIAKTGGFPNYLLDSSSFLAEYYKENDNIDSAYVYQNIALAAKDSLYDQEKRNKLQALALEETARQQEIKAALLEAKRNERLNLQYLGITAAIVVFILIFFILSRSIIIGEKWLSFLGIFILLLVFEFINLYFAPIIAEATSYSPIWTLLIMVGIAALLVPLHHKIEKYVTKKMVKKNKEIKIAAARRTLERLEAEE